VQKSPQVDPRLQMRAIAFQARLVSRSGRGGILTLEPSPPFKVPVSSGSLFFLIRIPTRPAATPIRAWLIAETARRTPALAPYVPPNAFPTSYQDSLLAPT